MRCCSTDSPEGIDALEEASLEKPRPDHARDGQSSGCTKCGGASWPVSRKTMLLMLKTDRFDHIGDGSYRFCSDPVCEVVYCAEVRNNSFTTDDLRVRVGIKERKHPIPICYCFGFDEADLEAEISGTGRTSIPDRIASLLRLGMCACEARNPSGACCLGEIKRVVARLTEPRAG